MENKDKASEVAILNAPAGFQTCDQCATLGAELVCGDTGRCANAPASGSLAGEGKRFDNVSCSQCGRSFGPGDHGFSHCGDHSRHDAIREIEKSLTREQWMTYSDYFSDRNHHLTRAVAYASVEEREKALCDLKFWPKAPPSDALQKGGEDEPSCKGDIRLGTACRKCPRCIAMGWMVLPSPQSAEYWNGVAAEKRQTSREINRRAKSFYVLGIAEGIEMVTPDLAAQHALIGRLYEALSKVVGQAQPSGPFWHQSPIILAAQDALKEAKPFIKSKQ